MAAVVDEQGGGAGRRWLGAWLLAVLVLQVGGRWTSNEVDDAFALFGIVVLVGMTRARHEAQPFAALTGLRARLAVFRVWIKEEFPRLGADLRGEPPVRRGVPRLLFVPAIAGMSLLALLLVRPFPADPELEAIARSYAYLPYLLGLAVLWCALFFLAAFGPFLPFSALRDAYLGARPLRGDALRDVPRRATLALAAVMLIAAILLPTRFALRAVFVAALLDLGLVWLPGQGRLGVLWRSAKGDDEHRSTDWRVLSTLEPALVLVAIGVPLVVLDPWSVERPAWGVAPITRALHWGACWGGAFFAFVIVALRLHHVVTSSLRPPSLPVKPRIHVESSSGAVARAARGLLRSDGWNAAPRGRRRADDVVVRVEPEAPEVDVDFVALSTPVPPATLADTRYRWRLRRRSEVRSRRNVMHGLETIFRHAARGDRSVGTGYIVAPHLWFLVGVERDIATPDMSEDVSLTGNLQPAYRAVMTPRARHHLWSILDGVGVDLIHVEYGVGFRRLRVALRVLFEVYDVHGGKRHVQERDFVGLHGVHVVVHDVDLEKPRASKVYPEPEYEQASRARILHLYRDRGGEEDPTEAPVQYDDLPLLV